MSNESYEKIVLDYLEDEFSLKKYKETDKYVVFVCRRADKTIVPNTMVVAVNKSNKKCGSSVYSEETAVDICMS